jgi:glycine dehydrogenase
MAARNTPLKSFIGMGYHNTITPPVIKRNILENPAWYTAYTPYQPEIAQGRLEALINFQSAICDLTGMEIANASLLDEGTAAAEAATLAHAVGSVSDGNLLLVDTDTHPQTVDVLKTRTEPLGIALLIAPVSELLARAATPREGERPFALLISNPGSSGAVRSIRADVATAHAAGLLVIVATDPLAAVLLESAGAQGADVVVGSSQRFGVPMGNGGPHAAFMATRDAFKRSLPGRLVGVSVDADGNPAYRLTLQTREQHIRREKATSNICTAQVLLAVIASMYAAWHGPDGLRAIAERVHARAATLAAGVPPPPRRPPARAATRTLLRCDRHRDGERHTRARADRRRGRRRIRAPPTRRHGSRRCVRRAHVGGRRRGAPEILRRNRRAGGRAC